MNSIKILTEKGFILKVIGDFREPLYPALVVWARNQPKKLFRCHVALSKNRYQHLFFRSSPKSRTLKII
ncbi:hypothetical protein EDD57_101172 [Baia soyae]|uniref:Uncharacterized protein n=1 Tax=Baia soyae TaxID=1544746 RepID=A0A4R2S2E8_9BACL|nr:hypothetical protein EDD57_101172 [Baia soyae]